MDRPTNARTLKFYGASDDLFEIDGGRKGEPDEISSSSCVQITDSEGGMVVSAHYAPGKAACWHIGVGQIDEDEAFPDWPLRFTVGAPGRGYSVVLTVEAPDDAVMTEIKAE